MWFYSKKMTVCRINSMKKIKNDYQANSVECRIWLSSQNLKDSDIRLSDKLKHFEQNQNKHGKRKTNQ